MCQLLGMNGNTPTDIVFSFTGFSTRAEEHKDGFGIAFFEDKGVRLFVDTSSARESPCRCSSRQASTFRSRPWTMSPPQSPIVIVVRGFVGSVPATFASTMSPWRTTLRRNRSRAWS